MAALCDHPTVHHLAAAMEQAWTARNSWQDIASPGRLAIQQTIDPNPGRHLAEMLLEQVKA